MTLLCGIIVPKMMIEAFGSEAYGTTVSITQFLAYITLLEGGIGGVARAVLYKPLAENDMDAISGIIGETRRFFRVIAFIFLAYVLVLACSFKSISGVTVFDWSSTFMLVLIISLSTFAQYYIGISYMILLQAAQKTYITNLINIAATVINMVIVVILILLDCSIMTVKLFSSMIYLAKPVVLWLYVKKHYDLHRCSKSDHPRLTQKWHGMGQHIAFFLHSNTDVVILTCLSKLEYVAVYSVYNMVVANIQNLASSFIAGMEALFGDLLVQNEHEKLNRTFTTYETIISVVAVMMFSVTAVMIMPFVRIYTAGITDADYEAPVFALLLILSALIYCLRMPYHSLVIAAGHFKQTQFAAYGEAALNIGLSILLVSKWGLMGVAAGTLLATLYRLLYYVIYISKRIVMRKPSLFMKRTLINALIFGVSVFAGWQITRLFEITNYLTWGFCGLLTGISAILVSVAVNVLFYRKDCKALCSVWKIR